MSTKLPRVNTPSGMAIWPKLNEPDRKFQPEGVYEVTLRLPESEADVLIAKFMEVHAESYRVICSKEGKKALKKAALPWKPAEDWDKETESKVEKPGFIDFKFKMKAKVTPRNGKSWEQRPALFDAKLNPLPVDSDPVGGGSIIRISTEVYCWYSASLGFGLTLRPKAVQVLELKTYTTDSGSHGFEAEDGFTVSAPSASFDSEETDSDF